MIHMSQRTILSPSIPIEDFRSFYWLKKELQNFCSKQGLSTSGSKHELQNGIEQFLNSGTIEKSNHKVRQSISSEEELSLDTTVPQGFTCTRKARDFLIEHAGRKFKYTVALQRYIKTNPGITFRQLIDEWKRQANLKKAGLKTKIGSQFEYNQFTRDFFADHRNKGKSREEYIAAWYAVRSSRGPRKHLPKD